MNPKELRSTVLSFGKWVLLAVLVGGIVGPCGAAFALALSWANATRAALPWLIYLLPAAGLGIVWLYRAAHQPGGGSTNAVFVAVRENVLMPLSTAPLIFVSTVATHLFGGSAGREGAALQLGGAISGTLGRVFKLDERDSRVMTMCGMAAAFSAVFGTPLAATVFTMEIVDVGTMYYAALVPCLLAALVGVWIAGFLGVAPESFALAQTVAATPLAIVQVVVLAALAGLLSIAFCELMHAAPRLYARVFPNVYLRVAAGGCLIAALTLLLGTTDYNGAGAAVLHAAVVEGHALPWAFLCKMLFTALTLGCGYKGGEIVPIFFTGATFG
ncbi:MAG: chloride channel protein, partial [Gemmiger sp.]